MSESAALAQKIADYEERHYGPISPGYPGPSKSAEVRDIARMIDDERLGWGFQELANHACGKLPEGWTINVSLERGSGCVDLLNPDGDLRDSGPSSCDESIPECVRRLVQAAIDYDSR